LRDRAGSRSAGAAGESPAGDWWRRAAVYQIYIRSFADANGDGIGDIDGIRGRLDYLRDLGADAIWITPWYPSPMADGGYDVADYRDIDPMFGSLADAEALVREAHDHGIKVLIDLVPNHTSNRHAWFREAIAAGRGSPERNRYIFRDGRGPGGDEPPNGWPSGFGGSAWERIVEPDGSPGQWYLHWFDVAQPDLNWEDEEVRAEFESILRFWFDRGVDGFRIDVASALVKDPSLPELPLEPPGGGMPDNHPYFDQEGVHDIYRSWRRLAATYTPARVLLGEIHVATAERLVRYLRPDELHGAFNFPFMRTPLEATALRTVIDATLRTHASVGASPTWVLSNHDEIRHATRFGRAYTGIRSRPGDELMPSDLALGRRRSRAAIMLVLALPGCSYLYQGEELGLPEVEDLPGHLRQDPLWEGTGHEIRGRDGCRVPLPWSGEAPPFGFGPPGSVPWLPQPADWVALTAAAEAADPGSMLALYREALRLRRTRPDFAGPTLRWLPSPPGTLLFARGRRMRCAVNFSAQAMPLPAGRSPVLESVPTEAGSLEPDALQPDAAAWFELPEE
jgi:alpha-glucosidase